MILNANFYFHKVTDYQDLIFAFGVSIYIIITLILLYIMLQSFNKRMRLTRLTLSILSLEIMTENSYFQSFIKKNILENGKTQKWNKISKLKKKKIFFSYNLSPSQINFLFIYFKYLRIIYLLMFIY